MTWTRLDDTFAEVPTVAELSDAAFRVHVEGLIYCNRLLTNGRLPRSQLRRVTAVEAPDLAVAELEQQGLWTPIEGDDAWQLDWTSQETADVVGSRKAQNAARQRRHKRHRVGLHDECDPARCPSAAQVTREVTRYPTREETRPRPVPTRPDPKESGRGRSAAACQHGKPRGNAIQGDGENASRICGQCEAERPARDALALIADEEAS